MIEILCAIRGALANILIVVLVCYVIAAIIFWKKNRTTVTKYGVGALFFFGVSLFAFNKTIESKVRKEIITTLQSGTIKELLINGEALSESKPLINELLKIGPVNVKRGSGFNNVYHVDLSTETSALSFSLYRNSVEPTKYLVLTNQYDYELKIGMIRTSISLDLPAEKKTTTSPLPSPKSSDIKTRAPHFDFENYQSYALSDTITIDLNGNGLLEQVYFSPEDCQRILITEQNQTLLTLGCNTEINLGFPSTIEWVDSWCVVSDKKVWQMLFTPNGDLDKDTMVNLDRPGIYIGKEEAGGGIIASGKQGYYWIHQAD